LHRFWTGVRQSAGDVSTDLTITGNGFNAGWLDSEAPQQLQLAPGVHAISLSAAATSSTQQKRWLILNNEISGVTTAFEIRWPGSGSSSMNEVQINTNSVRVNFRCTSSPPCYNILNLSPATPPVEDNW
jgi:hypothetical protein